MEQTFNMPEYPGKNKTLLWVAFSLAMLSVWGTIIIHLFIGSGSLTLFSMLVTLAFFGLLCYMATNRAVRTATLILIGCQLILYLLFQDFIPVIYSLVLLFVVYFFDTYAFSLLISDSRLTKQTKSWVAALCLTCIVIVVLRLSHILISFNSNLYVEYGDDLFQMPYYANPFYDVLLLLLRVLYSIAWYKFIFSGIFTEENDNEDRVHGYRLFNRYTVAFIIVTVVVVPAQYLVVLLFA